MTRERAIDEAVRRALPLSLVAWKAKARNPAFQVTAAKVGISTVDVVAKEFRSIMAEGVRD